MFTEGLDSNALKWVRQGGAKKDVYSSISTQAPRAYAFTSTNVGRGLGMPPQSKVRNGHLSVKVPIRGNNSDSESDMDISPDSDEDAHGRKYSVKLSPQDGKTGNGRNHFVSEAQKRKENGTEVQVMYSVNSTDASYMWHHKSGGVTSVRGTYSPDALSSRSNVEMTAKQEVYGRGPQNQKRSSPHIPSAPPFVGSGSVAEKVAHQSSTSGSTTHFNTKARRKTHSSSSMHDITSAAAGPEVNASAISVSARLPTFHASGLGPWYAVISYDACVRLCLNSWAKGCKEEAPYFLNNECALLRNAFGLQQVLLQPEEELMEKQSELVSETATVKSKPTYGKMKVQVRKVKMGLDPLPGCSFTYLKPSKAKLESVRQEISKLNAMLNAGFKELRKVRVTRRVPANSSYSQQSLAYAQASAQYVKEVSRLLKKGVLTLRDSSSSNEVVQETYSCSLRLKSISEEEAVCMQLGSGESHVFFPDSIGDDLIVEVRGSKGEYYGRVVARGAAIADDPSDKLRWWPIYREPEHELVGRIQLYINYSTSQVENSHTKCGCVAETVAYDLVLEVAMKAEHFQQRNLLIDGPWRWLLDKFASYYGVSDAYTNLRYLSYVMDVGTPTKDCLDLVYDLLLPVLMKGNCKRVLSHQENRILGEVEDQTEQILALVFENYKSLDESLPSGLMDVFAPPTGLAPPALEPAVKLYKLLHEILAPETQLKLTRYFQAAAKKRSRRLLSETEEFISSNHDRISAMDDMALSIAYQKMKSLVLNIRNEIHTDIEIHSQDILPSFIDLPHLSASIYSVDVCNRLRLFLVACPPSGPSPPVTELVIATSDFQRDLFTWNISPIKGGVDAKELFHSYITRWIQDKRSSLLELCKMDRVKWAGAKTQNSTTPFVDDMHDRLKGMLNEYAIIVSRWPEYAVNLENAVADVERAIVETLDKQYADVISPLKENLTDKIFGLKYVQKIAKRNVAAYFVPEELGILLNSMKRMLDVLWPKIDSQFKSWSSYSNGSGNAVLGEHLSEITVMLRAKFRNYLLAVVEKLAENTTTQNTTKLKKIIQESGESCGESDVQTRMQPLKDLLIKTMDDLHTVVEPHVFILICRLFWDHMGQDVLRFLENKRENKTWYKSSRIAVSMLDDIFASQMQQLLGNTLQEKDLEPPRSISEVRSMLCKDSANYKDNNYYI